MITPCLAAQHRAQAVPRHPPGRPGDGHAREAGGLIHYGHLLLSVVSMLAHKPTNCFGWSLVAPVHRPLCCPSLSSLQLHMCAPPLPRRSLCPPRCLWKWPSPWLAAWSRLPPRCGAVPRRGMAWRRPGRACRCWPLGQCRFAGGLRVCLEELTRFSVRLLAHSRWCWHQFSFHPCVHVCAKSTGLHLGAGTEEPD